MDLSEETQGHKISDVTLNLYIPKIVHIELFFIHLYFPVPLLVLICLHGWCDSTWGFGGKAVHFQTWHYMEISDYSISDQF